MTVGSRPTLHRGSHASHLVDRGNYIPDQVPLGYLSTIHSFLLLALLSKKPQSTRQAEDCDQELDCCWLGGMFYVYLLPLTLLQRDAPRSILVNKVNSIQLLT